LGAFSRALVPTPSAVPAAPAGGGAPARVATLALFAPPPAASIRRIAWLPVSAKNSAPALRGSMTRKWPLLKRAATPTPSAKPAAPAAPASVVTLSAVKFSRRIVWPAYSAKYATPRAASTSMPAGALSALAPSGPLRDPAAPVPATVVTAEVPKSRRRILWSKCPAISIREALSKANAKGWLKRAFAPAPSAPPGAPAPASATAAQGAGGAGVREGVGVKEGVAVPEGVSEGVAPRESEGVGVPVCDAVVVPVSVAERVRLGEPLGVCEAVGGHTIS
jgi:hypothetical protein